MTNKSTKPTPARPGPAQPAKRHDSHTGTFNNGRAQGNTQVMPRDPGTSAGPRPPTKK